MREMSGNQPGSAVHVRHRMVMIDVNSKTGWEIVMRRMTCVLTGVH